MDKSFTHYVGLDCGNQSHHMYVVDSEGNKVYHGSISHDSDGLVKMRQYLRDHTGDLFSVAACLESPVGGLVESLQSWGVSVFTINPKQLDRFRDRFTVAGAKDDSLDAMVLAQSLRTDFHLFRAFSPPPPLVGELWEYSRDEATTQKDLRRCGNRLFAKIAELYPSLLVLCKGADKPWFWALLRLIDPNRRQKSLSLGEVERFLGKYRLRRFDAKKILSAVKNGPMPLPQGRAKGIWVAIRDLCAQLVVLDQQHRVQKRRIRKIINQLCSSNAETGRITRLLLSLPGVGEQLAAVFLTECYHLLLAGDLNRLRAYSGVAPVTRQSGGKRIHMMRRACNQRVRWAIHLFARGAIVWDPATSAYYHRLRSRGIRFAQAMRAIGERFLRILVQMLATDTKYDPNRLKNRAAIKSTKEPTTTTAFV